MRTFTEIIWCPECGAYQEAVVDLAVYAPEDTSMDNSNCMDVYVMAVHVHNCYCCGYLIGESEWNVSDEARDITEASRR
jgi:hypothetical protein